MAESDNVMGADFFRFSVSAPLRTGETKVFKDVWAATPHDAVKRILFPSEIHDYEYTMPEEFFVFWNDKRRPIWEWGLAHNKGNLLMPSHNHPWVIVDDDEKETICQRRVRRPDSDWIRHSIRRGWIGRKHRAEQERKEWRRLYWGTS